MSVLSDSNNRAASLLLLRSQPLRGGLLAPAPAKSRAGGIAAPCPGGVGHPRGLSGMLAVSRPRPKSAGLRGDGAPGG